MTINVGINGMGRIGRMVIRAIIESQNKNIQIKHINNRSNSEASCRLIKYDSVHGKFNADLDYDENGKLVIAKGKNAKYDSRIATDRVLRALSEKKVTNTVGKDIDVGCDTICVHSDTPNAVEIIKGIKSAINK